MSSFIKFLYYFLYYFLFKSNLDYNLGFELMTSDSRTDISCPMLISFEPLGISVQAV